MNGMYELVILEVGQFLVRQDLGAEMAEITLWQVRGRKC